METPEHVPPVKRQIGPKVKAYLIRGAFYLLLLIATCAIPFALAQRGAAKLSVAEQDSHSTGATDQARVLSGGSSPALLPWTTVANYPQFIENAAVATNGTYVYAGTGNSNGSVLGFFYRYDPVGNSWTPLSSALVPVYKSRAVYASNTNSVYIFGGFDGSNVVNTTQIYNISTNTWSTGAPMPDVRAYANLAYYPVNGKIYVIGGYDAVFNESRDRKSVV